MSDPRFDFSFALQPRIAKRGNLCELDKTFGSLVHEAFECNRGDGLAKSRRFNRRWTDRQFEEALRDVWSRGYRIVSVLKERAPEPGTTPEFRIEDSDLYEGHGSDMKLKEQLMNDDQKVGPISPASTEGREAPTVEVRDAAWQPIENNEPPYGKRIMIFSPVYPAGDVMRVRIVSWVTRMTDATHWRELDEPDTQATEQSSVASQHRKRGLHGQASSPEDRIAEKVTAVELSKHDPESDLVSSAMRAAEKIAEYDEADKPSCPFVTTDCNWYCEHWKAAVTEIITTEMSGKKE